MLAFLLFPFWRSLLKSRQSLGGSLEQRIHGRSAENVQGAVVGSSAFERFVDEWAMHLFGGLIRILSSYKDDV